MRRTACTALCLLALAACSGQTANESETTATVDRDTLTRRQKDSILARMPLPQSRAVGKALGTADAAAARAAEMEAEQGR